MASKKKLLTSAVALGLAGALTLGGTFAWQSISQEALNQSANQVNPGGRLHNDLYYTDLNTTDSNVYVENFDKEDIFARVRLEEYMEVVLNYGTAGQQTQSVIGTREDTTETDDQGNETIVSTKYNYEVFDFKDHVNEDGTVSAGLVENGDKTDSNFTWTMGGEKTEDYYYMPTFNKNKDSLAADLNGLYKERVGGISKRDPEQYSGEAWTETSSREGYEIYDADSNLIDELKDLDITDLNKIIDEGNLDDAYKNSVKLSKKLTHYAEPVGETRGLISMTDWLKLVDEGKSTDNYWVYDDSVDADGNAAGGGWVYWSSPIKAGETTGLLLDDFTLSQVMNHTWYYAINVVGQFCTADDMGEPGITDADGNTTGGTGFYADGETVSESAKKLLDEIGVGEKDPFAPRLQLIPGELTVVPDSENKEIMFTFDVQLDGKSLAKTFAALSPEEKEDEAVKLRTYLYGPDMTGYGFVGGTATAVEDGKLSFTLQQMSDFLTGESDSWDCMYLMSEWTEDGETLQSNTARFGYGEDDNGDDQTNADLSNGDGTTLKLSTTGVSWLYAWDENGDMQTITVLDEDGEELEITNLEVSLENTYNSNAMTSMDYYYKEYDAINTETFHDGLFLDYGPIGTGWDNLFITVRDKSSGAKGYLLGCGAPTEESDYWRDLKKGSDYFLGVAAKVGQEMRFDTTSFSYPVEEDGKILKIETAGGTVLPASAYTVTNKSDSPYVKITDKTYAGQVLKVSALNGSEHEYAYIILISGDVSGGGSDDSDTETDPVISFTINGSSDGITAKTGEKNAYTMTLTESTAAAFMPGIQVDGETENGWTLSFSATNDDFTVVDQQVGFAAYQFKTSDDRLLGSYNEFDGNGIKISEIRDIALTVTATKDDKSATLDLVVTRPKLNSILLLDGSQEALEKSFTPGDVIKFTPQFEYEDGRFPSSSAVYAYLDADDMTEFYFVESEGSTTKIDTPTGVRIWNNGGSVQIDTSDAMDGTYYFHYGLVGKRSGDTVTLKANHALAVTRASAERVRYIEGDTPDAFTFTATVNGKELTDPSRLSVGVYKGGESNGAGTQLKVVTPTYADGKFSVDMSGLTGLTDGENVLGFDVQYNPANGGYTGTATRVKATYVKNAIALTDGVIDEGDENFYTNYKDRIIQVPHDATVTFEINGDTQLFTANSAEEVGTKVGAFDEKVAYVRKIGMIGTLERPVYGEPETTGNITRWPTGYGQIDDVGYELDGTLAYFETDFENHTLRASIGEDVNRTTCLGWYVKITKNGTDYWTLLHFAEE